MKDISDRAGGRDRSLPEGSGLLGIRLLGGLEAPAYFRWAPVFGRLVAAILLIPGAPLIGLLMLLVRLTSRGPGIYRQTRLGKGGRIFTLYKIRTMRIDAEKDRGAVWSRPGDPRVTPVGEVLRRLHLDEFPQLFNVFRGEMSLIGPRPERPEIAYVLSAEIPGYLNRLSVRPGITGLAQVNLDPDTDLDSVRRKLALDLRYITDAGVSLDLRLFLCTFLFLLGVGGLRAKRITGVRHEAPAPDGATVLPDELPVPTIPAEPLMIQPIATNGNGKAPLNAFTVDVEDYFHVSGFENVVRRDQWDQWDSRVVANTHRILDLLDRHNVKATFFILGWVARHHPQLVQEIHDCGHEIGSHSYWHRLIHDQSPREFRSDLRQTRDLLIDAIGQRVTAHRAPSFSVTKKSLWALDILVEEGFEVDTSIYPTYHDRYGIPDAEPRIHQITTSAGPLWEFPPTVAKFARLSIPVSGGGYFRLFPLEITLRLLTRVNRKHHRPFMFYIHPWELDPDQPRIRNGSPVARFRHYVNLPSTERRLEVLLQRFRFGRVCDVLEQWVSGADQELTRRGVPHS